MDDAYRRFRAVRFFGSLDGLRAASILAVVWHHAGGGDERSGLLGQGNKGVTLFFVISGFLIVTLLLRAKEQFGTFSLGRFWGRRMCRIFPIYFAVLAGYTAAVAWIERDPVSRATFFQNLPAFATFTSNWFVHLDAPRVIFFFAWSLAAEEQFYLVWPWMERFLSGGAALGLAVLGLIGTQALGFAFGPLANGFLPLKIATSVPAGILLGVILAHLLHDPQRFRALAAWFGRGWSVPAAVAVTLAALAYAPRLGNDLGDLLIALAMVGLVASCVIREDNLLAPALRWRPIAWIGTVSYGMYLLHMASVHAGHRVTAWLGVSSRSMDFAGGAVIAITLATGSYLTLERYFLTLKERWFSERPARGKPPVWARIPIIGSLLS